MKLEYTEGCICNSLTIDGVETIDLPQSTVKEALHKLIDKESDLGTLQYILTQFIEHLGTYTSSDEPCGCCGDYIDNYKLEI